MWNISKEEKDKYFPLIFPSLFWFDERPTHCFFSKKMPFRQKVGKAFFISSFAYNTQLEGLWTRPCYGRFLNACS